MVTNTAATAPTPSPAECTFTTGTCTGTSSYGFTKDNVFKNMEKKTCDAGVTAAAYPDICSRTALARNFMLGADSGKAHLESGIRLLYCNDQYLVIHTVNVPNHPVGLLGNPHPPGSGFDPTGTAAAEYAQQTVTRTNVVQYSVYKIPLVPQDLGTSSVQNNAARFSATFSAVLSVAATAVVVAGGELTFAAATSGNIHAGYIITGTGLADKTALSSCDSAEIVAGTGGVSSTTLTIAWTVIGTVCKDSKVASTCTDTAAGKYVKISSSYVRLSSCSIKGGVGTCTLASAQTVATGTTLQVYDSSTGATVKCLISEATTATMATSVTITGTHNSVYDLPSFDLTTNSPKAAVNYPGIPIYGPLAVSVTGQVLYPVFDDQGFTSQEMCEVDMCNGHAGKGFDYHYHGDPYHHTPGKCLYSPQDYADTVNGHPPLIGFSLDGFKVFGRHLAETNTGYSTALDDCGGHSHGNYGYHYHSQVLQLNSINAGGYSTSTLSTLAGGSTSYYAPIPGVYKCWRGDIGAQRLFGNQVTFDKRAEFEDLKPCENTKHYWAHGSLKDITGGVATSLAAAFDQFTSTTPVWPDQPTLAPIPAPSSLPTSRPSLTSKPSSRPSMARPVGTAVFHSHHTGKTCESAVFRYTVLPTKINTCVPSASPPSSPPSSAPSSVSSSSYTKLTCSTGDFYVHLFKASFAASDPTCSASSTASLSSGSGSAIKKQALCTRDEDGGSFVKAGCGNVPFELWSRSALVITSINAPAGQAYDTSLYSSICNAAASTTSASAYGGSVTTEYLLLDACAPVYGLPGAGDRHTVLYRRRLRVVTSPASAQGNRILLEEEQFKASDERCSDAPKRVVSAQYTTSSSSSSSSSSSVCLPDPLFPGRWYSNAVLRQRFVPPGASPKPTRRPTPKP